jgi:predicted transposase YdaD
MTLAEQILQKGRQKGRQEGRQEGLQEILANLREWVLEVLVLRLGEVPAEIRAAIDTMDDEAHLKALHRAAIQAASMDEFARSL